MLNRGFRSSRALLLRCLVAILGIMLTGLPALADEPSCPQLQDNPHAASLRDEFLESSVEVSKGMKWVGMPEGLALSSIPEDPKYWRARRGSELLSEEEFFALCGLDQHAVAARRHRESSARRATIGKVLTTVGAVAALAGGIALGAAEEESSAMKWAITATLGGSAVAGVGAFVTIPALSNRHKAHAPYTEARAAADAYNDRLCEDLAKELE